MKKNINEIYSKNCIIQNLKDAGCEDRVISHFLSDFENGNFKEGLQLLQKHRGTLLNALHMEQKRIDCLDYLIFILQKQTILKSERESKW